MKSWVSAFWNQIKGTPVPDPWDTDPDIIRERERQHALGVTDVASVYRAESQFWREKDDRKHRRASPNG